MIFFKPTVNTDNPDEIQFEAIEDDISNGKCTLRINGSKAEIIYVEFKDGKH